MENTKKLCIDCAYFVTQDKRCKRSYQKTDSPVSGEVEYSALINDDAYQQRFSWFPWNCGKNARYYKPVKN